MGIKEIREALGLSRKEMCDQFGIPYRTLQSWEIGDRPIPEYTLKLFNRVLSLMGMVVKLEKEIEEIKKQGSD